MRAIKGPEMISKITITEEKRCFPYAGQDIWGKIHLGGD